jgi:hypothetical protein
MPRRNNHKHVQPRKEKPANKHKSRKRTLAANGTEDIAVQDTMPKVIETVVLKDDEYV